MSKDKWQRLECRRGRGRAVLAAAVTIGMIFTITAYGGDAARSPVAALKQAFDAAMGKPLAERIVALEAPEGQIDRGIADSTLAGKDKGDAPYYKYHLQRNLAKYPEAARTYKAYVQCASVCEAMAGEFPRALEIEATALYHLWWSAFRMNGTMNRCVKACKELIGRHPE